MGNVCEYPENQEHMQIYVFKYGFGPAYAQYMVRGAIPFTTASFSPYGPMAVHFTPYFMFPTHLKGVQPVPARHGQPDGPKMALPNLWIKDAGRNSLPGGVVEMPRSLICVGIRLFSIWANLMAYTTYSLHPPYTQYALIGGA